MNEVTSSSSNWVAVALAAITLITVIVNAWVQRSRELRARQWELEDRKTRDEASAGRALELKEDLATTRRHIGQAIAATSQELKVNTAKTVEATVAAQKAYDASAAAVVEANGMNKKLEALGIKVRDAIDKKPRA